jgi:hypothetical protein
MARKFEEILNFPVVLQQFSNNFWFFFNGSGTRFGPF